MASSSSLNVVGAQRREIRPALGEERGASWNLTIPLAKREREREREMLELKPSHEMH